MTLTLVGDVILGTFLTLIADRVGRRKILLAGSVLMVMTGVILATLENFWILLFAAVIGVVSATGGDFGPFRSIEESVLSQLTTPQTRSDVLAWYVTLSAWGSSIGSETSGRFIEYFQHRPGWTLREAYHAIFWVYAIMGVVNVVFVLLLTNDCEADGGMEKQYSQVAQADSNQPGDSFEMTDGPERADIAAQAPRVASGGSWISRWMGNISAPTLKVVWKLWVLLAIDSLADGMTPYSLTTYYMDIKFHPSKASLGDAVSISYFLQAVGGMFAGPLARKIGLVNTMVFTHIPSSAAVLLFPWPSAFWMTVALLFLRSGLNNMDQAPRTALIAAIVRPDERTAVMGITSMLRTLAATAGPMVTGFLAGSDRFWVAFVAGGAFRLTYDIGLWIWGVNIDLHKHEGKPKEQDIAAAQEFRLSDSEDDESEDGEHFKNGNEDDGQRV